jgi:hypothetical protein
MIATRQAVRAKLHYTEKLYNLLYNKLATCPLVGTTRHGQVVQQVCWWTATYGQVANVEVERK